MTLFDGRERRRLVSVAYRMLGSTAEAEDLVQEAYLRLHCQRGAAIENHCAWLTVVVARLAVDRLRHLQAERRHYLGEWLPEPWLGEAVDDSTQDAPFLSTDLSYGLLLLLERLTPVERVTFVLHEALDYGHRDIASIVQKSESNVRQILHRARTHLRRNDASTLSTEARAALLDRLVAAVLARDSAALAGLLAKQVEFHGDGGGKVPAARKPIFGTEPVARFLLATAGARASDLSTETIMINGVPGCAWILDGQLAALMVTEPQGRDTSRVECIYNIANPDKLRATAQRLGRELYFAAS